MNGRINEFLRLTKWQNVYLKLKYEINNLGVFIKIMHKKSKWTHK